MSRDRPAYGRALRTALEKQGIQQVWLADELGVSRQMVHNWCKSGVSMYHVIGVARLLSVSPDVLRPDLFRVD